MVSPGAVVRRAGWRTITVRAEDVSDVTVRPAINGPVMIISTGSTKVGVPLPSAYRKPLARAALASFLRHAGVDLPSLRGLGLPVPVKPSRAVAGPILSRPGGAGGPAEGPAGEGGGPSERSSGRGGTPLGVPVRDVADRWVEWVPPGLGTGDWTGYGVGHAGRLQRDSGDRSFAPLLLAFSGVFWRRDPPAGPFRPDGRLRWPRGPLFWPDLATFRVLGCQKCPRLANLVTRSPGSPSDSQQASWPKRP